MTEETQARLNNRQRMFVEEYLVCWNASEAARRAGYRGDANTVGPRLLANVGIRQLVEQRIKEKIMSTDEVLIRLTEQARGDLGVFFKTEEVWTRNPRPSHEVIEVEEEEIVDKEGNPTGHMRSNYLVRLVVLDTEKLVDPRFSHLVHKFSDSPKNGLGIELYNQQTALQTLAKIHGLMVDRTEITGKDGGPVEQVVIYIPDNGRGKTDGN